MVKTTFAPGYKLWPEDYQAPKVRATRVIDHHTDYFRSRLEHEAAL